MVAKLNLYPLYVLRDANGVARVRCVDLENAKMYRGEHGYIIELEPRNLEAERDLPISRRAEIDAIYRRGCE